VGDRARRVLDLVGAGAASVVLAPVAGVLAWKVRRELGPPVLFRQQRAGRDGEPFTLLKFRSMRDRLPGEELYVDDAARLTPFGARLRSTSLDELPQLVNVLRGDMALVGPRPLPLAYVERYDLQQRRRLEVRPGITGWAQVNGRNALDWAARFELDLWYVEHRSVLLDLRVLALTVRAVLRREGISGDGSVTMSEFTGTAATTDPGADVA
jgi:lipopolysaccharide/colanic/teichoic acid biosynthesis glycosyltransferase